MKPLDNDIRWALDFTAEEAEIISDLNGSHDDLTKNARRLEVILRRLTREAGYDVNQQGADYAG